MFGALKSTFITQKSWNMMSANCRQDGHGSLSDAWCQMKGGRNEVFSHLGGMCEKELESQKTKSGNLPIVVQFPLTLTSIYTSGVYDSAAEHTRWPYSKNHYGCIWHTQGSFFLWRLWFRLLLSAPCPVHERVSHAVLVISWPGSPEA